MKIALAQIDTRVGDFEGNRCRVLDAVGEAARAGADLVLLPELVLTGCPPLDLLLDPSFLERAQRTLDETTAELAGGPAVVLGTVLGSSHGLPGPPGLANAAVLLAGGRRIATAEKRLLSHELHEARWYAPGAPSAPLPFREHVLGMLLSDDLRDETQPVHPAAELRRAGADLLLTPAASPFRAGIVARRVHDARRALRPLAYVNAVGASDALVFDGGSFVLDGEGRAVVRLPRFREAVECADLSATLPARRGGDLGAEEEIFEALALGVRDFVAKNGLPRVVLGLSGGVDSALVAAIAAAAVGPQRVSAVALPSRHTDPRSTEAAREVAARLGVGFELRSIEPLCEAARHTLADLLDGSEAAAVVDENLQARLRALVLLALVNRRGGLLLNTSNRTELALGYGTLHGDLAGTLCVIGDLPKTTVYAVARWHAQRFGSIPPFVLERAPTAELRPGQVDPFDYDTVVPIVESLLAGRAGAGTAEEERLRRLIRASEHKRVQAGIVLQVSDRAFGAGLVPVTRAF